MDTLTTFAIAALAASVAGALASTTLGARYHVAPPLAHAVRRHGAMRSLRAEVRQLVAEHALELAARPIPRARHSAHCPACGRFAHVTSTGPRGTWTRCSAHGIRLRATRRIGRAERTLFEVVTYRPLVEAVTLDTSPLSIAPPVRLVDWLDGVPELTAPRALAA